MKTPKTKKGVALIEFTIVALLLIAILFGIAEMAWMFSRYMLVSAVARQACRQYALADSVSNVSALILETSAELGLKPGSDGYNLIPELTYRTRSGNSWGPWLESADSAEPGDQVRVKITYTYPALVGAFILKDNTATVSAESIMRREESFIDQP